MTGSIQFGKWVWDPNTLELRNGAHVATLEPRVARLLEYLVTHPGELLSHDRIIEAVWDGRIVSDEAVRRALEIVAANDDISHFNQPDLQMIMTTLIWASAMESRPRS